MRPTNEIGPMGCAPNPHCIRVGFDLLYLPANKQFSLKIEVLIPSKTFQLCFKLLNLLPLFERERCCDDIVLRGRGRNQCRACLVTQRMFRISNCHHITRLQVIRIIWL